MKAAQAAVSSSFDKSGKASIQSKHSKNSVNATNLMSFHGNAAQSFSKRPTVLPSSSIVKNHGAESAGTQSIINTSATHLPLAPQQVAHNQSTKEPTHMPPSTGLIHHTRTKSDANYIMNLNSKTKNNFVISSANHVYQNKKTTNLKSMNNNNN